MQANRRELNIADMKRPIYYDTETTGVRPERDFIIEIAAFDPVQNRTFCSFVNPQIPIPEEVTAITSITDDMVKDAPTYKEVGKAFMEFCGQNVILIAHNNDSFDKHFLDNEAARHNLPMPSFQYIDSLKWARRYRPDLPKHNLQYLREMFQIPKNQAHRALDDVIVLYKIFSQMIDDLAVEQVYDLLYNTKPQAPVMPFGKHRGEPLSKVPKNYLSWLAKSGAFDKPENQELKENLLSLGLIN